MEHYVRTIHKPTQVPSEAIKSPDKLSNYLSTLSITPPSHLKEAFASYRYERRSLGKPPASPPRASSSIEVKSFNHFYRPSYFPPIRRVNIAQRLQPAQNKIKASKPENSISGIDNSHAGSTTFHTHKPWKELMDIEICCEKSFGVNDEELGDMHLKIDP